MKVYQHTQSWPAFRNTVLTIGTFDGVHEGHRQIFHLLKQQARIIGGETVIITFHPHPRNVVGGAKEDIRLINTIEERIELIRREGIDHMIIIPFTEAFSKLPAKQYIEEFLIGNFHPHTLIIGYDHRFGCNREGNYQLLEAYRDAGAFALQEIPAFMIEHIKVSSTHIRQCLVEGKAEEANKLLGYPFFFSGTVVHGNKLGRTLGYPTANIEPDAADKIMVADGIYAVTVSIEDEQEFNIPEYKGMMSIGLRPTINGSHRVIEVNIFDFDADIYSQKIRVHLHAWLRSEVRFNSLDALTEQMHTDKINSLRALEHIG